MLVKLNNMFATYFSLGAQSLVKLTPGIYDTYLLEKISHHSQPLINDVLLSLEVGPKCSYVLFKFAHLNIINICPKKLDRFIKTEIFIFIYKTV